MTKLKLSDIVKKKTFCWCGCGELSKSNFLPGHDSKLHSLLLAKMKECDPDIPSIVLEHYQDIKFILRDEKLCTFVAGIFVRTQKNL